MKIPGGAGFKGRLFCEKNNGGNNGDRHATEIAKAMTKMRA
jgi:hypothetical protein